MLQKGLFLYINPLNNYNIVTNQVSLHQVKPTTLQNYIIITKTTTISSLSYYCMLYVNEALKAPVSLVRHKPGLINQDYHIFLYVNQLKLLFSISQLSFWIKFLIVPLSTRTSHKLHS